MCVSHLQWCTDGRLSAACLQPQAVQVVVPAAQPCAAACSIKHRGRKELTCSMHNRHRHELGPYNDHHALPHHNQHHATLIVQVAQAYCNADHMVQRMHRQTISYQPHCGTKRQDAINKVSHIVVACAQSTHMLHDVALATMCCIICTHQATVLHMLW
jgi:hypothetical protein